jgi:hypothetical protein
MFIVKFYNENHLIIKQIDKKYFKIIELHNKYWYIYKTNI